MKLEDLTLDVEQQIDIKAPPEKVFPAVLERFGKKNTRPDGESLQLQIEAKPGGRWYRDRSNPVARELPPRHRALGMIDPEHRKGVSTGWNHMLAELKKDAE